MCVAFYVVDIVISKIRAQWLSCSNGMQILRKQGRLTHKKEEATPSHSEHICGDGGSSQEVMKVHTSYMLKLV